jgi:hypothetical protein
MDMRRNFRITSVSEKVPVVASPNPLGALADLIGIWKGQGFNQIWRPNSGGAAADHFLELNETIETLQFTEIP